jgi:hypothetical protein
MEAGLARLRSMRADRAKTEDATRAAVWCDTTTELDTKMLVWTRSEAMPLERLSSRVIPSNVR